MKNPDEDVPDFARDWMPWIVLRHFLPPRLLRELLDATARQLTDQRAGISKLFEEQFDGTTLWGESWLLRPRPTSDRVELHLQEVIRAVAWQNDESGTLSPGWKGGEPIRLLHAVSRLGAADFGWSEAAFDEVAGLPASPQPSLISLLSAIKSARVAHRTAAVQDFWDPIIKILEDVPWALRAMAIKHIADLCADADVWDKALHGYRRTQDAVDRCSEESEWREVARAWQGIVMQSEAAAVAVLQGPNEATELLQQYMQAASLSNEPLLLANCSVDASTVLQESSAEWWTFPDRRVALLKPTLLHASHETSIAVAYWLAGKHQYANRWFWATLRRQVALGSIAASQKTKALYARALIDELSSGNPSRPGAFTSAVHLLTESGRYEAAARVGWNDAVVDAHVSHDVVCQVVARAGAFDGARLRRELVVIELFRAWTARLAPSRDLVATAMLKHLASLARVFPTALDRSKDVGRRSAEALLELADARPELRGAVAADVASAVLSKLTDEDGWHGPAAALKLGLAYADAFDSGAVQDLACTTLDLLGETDPATDLWPVVRPALEFLVAEPVKAALRASPELEQRVLGEVLRFGTRQESEHSRLFYYLRNLTPALFESPDIRAQLEVPLAHVREHAKRTNASNVVEHICALLLAPAAAGADGVGDAIQGLVAILRSAQRERRSMALAYAYEPVLLLVDEREALESALGKDRLTRMLGKLPRALVGLWRAVADRPLLLAAYSFPPATAPDSVAVHNWAFASRQFAEAYGGSEEMDRALDAASANGELHAAISLARATRALLLGAGAEVALNARSEDREVFYSALGRRLVQLHRMSNEAAKELCTALVQQCLRLGPRAVDAPVLLAAARLGLEAIVQSGGLAVYAHKLERDRELRLTLGPIIQLFEVQSI